MNISRPEHPGKSSVPWFWFGLWLTGVGGGLTGLWAYSAVPSLVDSVPSAWPGMAGPAAPQPGRTLVMFVHPRCFCSQASLAELAEVVEHTRGQLAVKVRIVLPPGSPARWTQGTNARLAAAIPGADVALDRDGVEARRFHASTSGETLVYGPGGRLEFHGGITGVRGHVGPNAGASAIEGLAQTGSAPRATTPVFGCALFNEFCSAARSCPP